MVWKTEWVRIGECSLEIDKKYVGIPDGVDEDGFEISVYEDDMCSKEVKNIDFGPIKPGEEIDIWYWIKNTGEVKLPKVCIGMGIIDENGWQTIDDNFIGGEMEIGEKKMVPFTLKVEQEAAPGKYAGSIPITVYGPDHLI